MLSPGVLRSLVIESKREGCGVDLGLGFHQMRVTEERAVCGVGEKIIQSIEH